MADPNQFSSQFDMNQLMSSFSNPNMGTGGGSMFGMPQNTNMFSSDGGQYNNMFGAQNTDMFAGGNQNQLGNSFGAAGGQDGGWFNSDTMSNIGTGINAAQSLFSLYAGMKGLGIAEDRNKMAKTNLSNQAKLANERLKTRQDMRLRSRGITGAEKDKAVAEFMKQNAVSGG